MTEDQVKDLTQHSIWVDYDDGHAGGYPHECDRCTGSSGRMSCDLPKAHDGAHYNDNAGTLFR